MKGTGKENTTRLPLLSIPRGRPKKASPLRSLHPQRIGKPIPEEPGTTEGKEATPILLLGTLRNLVEEKGAMNKNNSLERPWHMHCLLNQARGNKGKEAAETGTYAKRTTHLGYRGENTCQHGIPSGRTRLVKAVTLRQAKTSLVRTRTQEPVESRELIDRHVGTPVRADSHPPARPG